MSINSTWKLHVPRRELERRKFRRSSANILELLTSPALLLLNVVSWIITFALMAKIAPPT
jgi:hypothetical protein